MSKLQVFDNKQTNWSGLWWHPETNSFVSSTLNISELRKFKGQIKLVVRKNKFFNNGENGRPNYCFTLRDANSENALELIVEETKLQEDEERMYTKSEVQKAIDGATRDALNGYTDNIVSDYL